MASEKLRKKHLSRPPVKPLDLRPGMSVRDLVDEYRAAGAFNAGRLAQACDLFGRMLDDDCTVAVTVAGAMSPAGLGGAFRALMQAGFVDVIISTGANLYHDLHFALGLPVQQGDFRANDVELFKAGIERIYDVYITDESLLDTDRFVREVCARARFGGPVSTARVHRALGEAVLAQAPSARLSWVAEAARLDVPIYVSSPGDSSIGMNLAELKLGGEGVQVDPDLDVLETTAIVHAAEKNGVMILGGGSPKNFYLQTQPTLWQILGLNRGGHDYVLQVTTEGPQWGGLSGATPSEAISWGKVQAGAEAHHVVVYGDTTVVAPIVWANTLATRKKKTPKRLYRRLDAMFEDMRSSWMRKRRRSAR